MKSSSTKLFAAILALTLFTLAAPAAVLNFETINGAVPIEGMSISNQFQAQFGISFRRTDGGFPAIAKKGAPQVAFNVINVNPSTYDTLHPSDPRANDFGDFFLSDDAGQGLSHVIIMDFNTRVAMVSGYVFDLDAGGQVIFTAYSDGGTNVVGQIVLNAGDPQTGEGRSTPWSFNHITNDIQQIRISGDSTVGFDNFDSSYTPLPQQPAVLDVHLYAGLLIQGDVGRPYRVDYADRLSPTNWIPQTNLFLPNSPFLYFDVTSTNATQRFYRAIGLP